MRTPTKRVIGITIILVLMAGVIIISWQCRAAIRTSVENQVSYQPAAPPHSGADYSPVSIARDQCRKLTNALRDFHAKRGHRPLPEGLTTDEKAAFPIDRAMLDALTGKDTVLNTAGVNYLKGAGITAPVPEGRFFAAFDFNGDGSIPDPSSPEKAVAQDILVWSAGEDGKAETWEDNAFAWLKP